MVFRPSRERHSPDRFLHIKMVLFALGGAVALAGFMLELNWLVWIAVLPLAAGLGLNLKRHAGNESAEDLPQDDSA